MLVGTYDIKTNKDFCGIFYFNEIFSEKIANIENPSFLCKVEKNNQTFILSVSEKEDGEIYSYEYINKKLNFISTIKTNGSEPCHISYHNNYLFVSNYSSGSLTIISTGSNMQLLKIIKCIKYEGIGICENRQTQSHIHSTLIYDNNLFVADLGLDKIYVYDLDDFNLRYEIKTKDKYGPRHFCYNSNLNIIYCICELSNKIILLKKNNNKYHIINEINLLNQIYNNITITSAEIKFKNDVLYCSIRGINKIAKINLLNDGHFDDNIIYYDSFGNTPRHFNIYNNDIYVTNQNSNNIVNLGKNIIYNINFSPVYILIL